MNLKLLFYLILASGLFAPFAINAQDNKASIRTGQEDRSRLGFIYTEKQETEADTKNKADRFQNEINNFINGLDNWKFVSAEIDKSGLNANASNFKQLNDELQSSFTKDVIYIEGKGKALLGKSTDKITPFYYGVIAQNANEVTLSHKVEGCDNCDKTVKFTRYQEGNKLILRIGADDESLSDVFYLLTFNK
jgi:hypothetical protein